MASVVVYPCGNVGETPNTVVIKEGKGCLFEGDLCLVEEEAAADRAVDLFGEVLGLELVAAAGTDHDGPHDEKDCDYPIKGCWKNDERTASG